MTVATHTDNAAKLRCSAAATSFDALHDRRLLIGRWCAVSTPPGQRFASPNVIALPMRALMSLFDSFFVLCLLSVCRFTAIGVCVEQVLRKRYQTTSPSLRSQRTEKPRPPSGRATFGAAAHNSSHHWTQTDYAKAYWGRDCVMKAELARSEARAIRYQQQQQQSGSADVSPVVTSNAAIAAGLATVKRTRQQQQQQQQQSFTPVETETILSAATKALQAAAAAATSASVSAARGQRARRVLYTNTQQSRPQSATAVRSLQQSDNGVSTKASHRGGDSAAQTPWRPSGRTQQRSSTRATPHSNTIRSHSNEDISHRSSSSSSVALVAHRACQPHAATSQPHRTVR